MHVWIVPHKCFKMKNIVCSLTSEYFSFYDEYGHIHYDNEITIMLYMMHDDHCTSGHRATTN